MILGFLGFAACSSETPEDPLAGIKVVGNDPTDIPLAKATDDEAKRFLTGDARFDAVFRDVDGLGPLYIRQACGSCHQAAMRGPGAVQKMALVEADGITPLPDQSELPNGHTARPYMTAGAHTPIAPPDEPDVKLSSRLGPAVFGRGYLEAVDDAEIVRLESEQASRDDGIHGRINRVTYHSKPNPDQPYHAYTEGQTNIIGRFGFKARISTLDEFTADAFQGDMGLTTPLRPVELSNPDGLADDMKPGVDIDLATVNVVADYMRLLEIPERDLPTGRGQELFAEARCSACHAPSLKTSSSYPIAALAGIDAAVFTDFLLHDMGDALADGLAEESATSRTWKTAPLIGVRHLKGFLHDGRAKTVEMAVLAHEGPGSEANDSIARFRALSLQDRNALLAFVEAL
ncbi:Putative thiol oxidoreductase with 2 cytochrome c heme-binding site [Minicystis rosea]|nr:Putative thiol oxidoreductase with 2 cytochrome c heme-binding site [Minicystis rosea]